MLVVLHLEFREGYIKNVLHDIFILGAHSAFFETVVAFTDQRW